MKVPAILRRDPGATPFSPSSAGFPGQWLGVVSLITAPLFLLAGELLKAPHYFYFPAQLQTFSENPSRMYWAYALWTIGLFLLWPAFTTLASLICRTRPLLGRIAGTAAITGVLVNCFYEGVNHLAFKLTEVQGVEPATRFIDETYGWLSVAYALTWTDNLGWLLLGVAAYYTRVFGWFRALCVAYMAAHASGVLKGYTVDGLIGDILLCAAFITLGIELIRGRFSRTPQPDGLRA